jgi:dihydropteroate synthase
MTARIIEIKNRAEAAKEMLALGVDRPAVALMADKAVQRIVKLSAVRPVVANIIKQEMLALGGEAATARGAITHAVKETDVLILGTVKQLMALIRKLKMGYFGLPKIALEIETVLKNYDRPLQKLKIGNKTWELGKRTYIMGILNVTPDSFSDGGQFSNTDDALAQAEKMKREGADIIDVGGESTRPGARPVKAAEEIKRIVPVVRELARNNKTLVSVDTRKASVARAALKAGAQMVNDISGLRYDKKMAGVIADYQVPVCIMHMQGIPENMQEKPHYTDLMGEIINYLAEGLAIAEKAGILLGKLLVDPGIGFGKTLENNLAILKRLRELKVLGCPILIGPSRKAFIGKVLDLPVDERLEGTAAAVAIAIAQGADIVRVHDVREMKRVACLTDALIREK